LFQPGTSLRYAKPEGGQGSNPRLLGGVMSGAKSPPAPCAYRPSGSCSADHFRLLGLRCNPRASAYHGVPSRRLAELLPPPSVLDPRPRQARPPSVESTTLPATPMSVGDGLTARFAVHRLPVDRRNGADPPVASPQLAPQPISQTAAQEQPYEFPNRTATYRGISKRWRL